MKMYTNNIQGWIRGKALDFLYNEAQKHKSILEIGSWKGKSTVALLEGTKGKVTAVDYFKGSGCGDETHKATGIYEEFLKNTKQFENLRTLKMSSYEASEKLKGEKFDMIFIDADHSYESVKQDIQLWKDRATKIICGDDYNQAWKGVIRAVNEEFNKIDLIESIWLIRKC